MWVCTAGGSLLLWCCLFVYMCECVVVVAGACSPRGRRAPRRCAARHSRGRKPPTSSLSHHRHPPAATPWLFPRVSASRYDMPPCWIGRRQGSGGLGGFAAGAGAAARGALLQDARAAGVCVERAGSGGQFSSSTSSQSSKPASWLGLVGLGLPCRSVGSAPPQLRTLPVHVKSTQLQSPRSSLLTVAAPAPSASLGWLMPCVRLPACGAVGRWLR